MRIAIVGPVTGKELCLAGADSLTSTHHFSMNSDLVNDLIVRGHEVHVFTGGDVSKILRLEDSPHSITVVPRAGGRSAIWLYLPTIRALKREIKASGSFDIIHAHWLYDYSAASLAISPNALVTVHDWPGKIVKLAPSIPSISRFLLSMYVRKKVRFSTAPSEYMREVSEKKLNLPNTTIVANGFPSAYFTPFTRRDRSKTRLLAINNGFDRRKNVSRLIEAFGLVRKIFPDAQLELIGNGYGVGDGAHQFAVKRRLTEGIIFTGRVEREAILASLSAATLFVHPSLEESFGMVVIEAMSQGVGVVGGRKSGAVPWLLNYGECGFLSDVSSTVDLARAIMEGLKNRDLLDQIAQRGWSRARTEFTIDTMTNAYLKLYREICER